MKNKMIESLLHDIFSRKDGKKENAPANRVKEAPAYGEPCRPNYQRNKANDRVGYEKLCHEHKENGGNLDIYSMMRKYTR